MKDVNLIEPAHEPSQAKLELGSFTTEPISSQAFFERVSSELRVTSFLNAPTNYRVGPNSCNFCTRMALITNLY
ncbi:hypothetical protein HanPI659440_Chr04g0148821 [Helianthus annuus]|nr:hypothetical protein HanPI659440_Chr04g0148821 [Helianthus annuus]